jgi:hypothetical protein
VGDGGLWALGQNDGDAVAAFHAQREQRVAEPVRGRLDLCIGVGGGGAGFVLEEQRDAARAML